MVPDPSFGSLLMARRRRKDIILIRNIIWHTRRSQFGRLYWWPAPKTEQAACCQEKTGTFESKSKIMQTCNDVVFLDYLGTRTAFACSRRCHLVATTTTKCVHCWDKFTVGNYFISPRSGSTVRVAGYDMLECPGIVLLLVKLLWHQVVLLLVKLLWHQVRSQRAAGTAVSNYWASKSKDCLLQNVRRASHL